LQEPGKAPYMYMYRSVPKVVLVTAFFYSYFFAYTYPALIMYGDKVV